MTKVRLSRDDGHGAIDKGRQKIHATGSTAGDLLGIQSH